MGGQASDRRRTDTLTRRCAWCGLVFTAEGWREERRRELAAQITHGICDGCHASWAAREIDAPAASRAAR